MRDDPGPRDMTPSTGPTASRWCPFANAAGAGAASGSGSGVAGESQLRANQRPPAIPRISRCTICHLRTGPRVSAGCGGGYFAGGCTGKAREGSGYSGTGVAGLAAKSGGRICGRCGWSPGGMEGTRNVEAVR